MKLMSRAVVLLAVLLPVTSAHAQQESCIEIIKFSRTSDILQRSEEELSSQAGAFCNEYRSARGNTKSVESSASYKLFAASFGQSSTSVETLAATYCGSSNSTDKSVLAYSRHLELISGDAYRAYQQCIISNARTAGVIFTLQSATETVAHFRAYHKNVASAGEARVVFEITPEATGARAGCRIADGSSPVAAGTGSMSIKPTQGRLITCTRSSAAARTSITFNNQDGNDSFNYIWPAYQQGIPFDALQRFRDEASANARALKEELGAFRTTLKGVVVPFEATQCPKYWKPYPKAYGRFIRGLDVTGGTDPDRRGPGSLQEDDLKAHAHLINVPNAAVYKHGDAGGGGHAGGLLSRPTDSTGGTETRPKNVTLLYCMLEWQA